MKDKERQRLSKKILNVLEHILTFGSVGTQEDIKKALEKEGYHVNQSRISRLLRKTGAVKTLNEEGKSVYMMPKESSHLKLENSLSQLILEINANEVQIVIHTNPGSASIIAGLLDQNRESLGILGTVAGDDMLFIVPKSIKKTQEVVDSIRDRLFN